MERNSTPSFVHGREKIYMSCLLSLLGYVDFHTSLLVVSFFYANTMPDVRVLRRRGINKKTAAERKALRCLRDSWKKSFVADAADRRDAFLRGHRPPFFSSSPFSTSPRSPRNGGFLTKARNTRLLRHISTINDSTSILRGEKKFVFELAMLEITLLC